MSRAANDWAWDLSIRPATLKLILLSMADRADEYHQCYPSIARLVKDTCLNEKTVQQGLKTLQKMGVIADTGERRGPTRRVRVFALNIGFKSPQNRNDSKNGNYPKNGVLNDPEIGVLNDPENGVQNQSLEPVIEPNKNNIKKSELDYSCWPELPDEQIMIDWISMRRRQNANVSQTVINRFGKELHKAKRFGLSVNDCLTECVTRNWRGFECQWLLGNLGGGLTHAANKSHRVVGSGSSKPGPADLVRSQARQALERIDRETGDPGVYPDGGPVWPQSH